MIQDIQCDLSHITHDTNQYFCFYSNIEYQANTIKKINTPKINAPNRVQLNIIPIVDIKNTAANQDSDNMIINQHYLIKHTPLLAIYDTTLIGTNVTMSESRD